MASSDIDKMSPAERRAGASLAAIFALRMLGLFLILPVFAVHAHGMPGPLETALQGVADHELSVQHVVRSFDPCMVCTVH